MPRANSTVRLEAQKWLLGKPAPTCSGLADAPGPYPSCCHVPIQGDRRVLNRKALGHPSVRRCPACTSHSAGVRVEMRTQTRVPYRAHRRVIVGSPWLCPGLPAGWLEQHHPEHYRALTVISSVHPARASSSPTLVTTKGVPRHGPGSPALRSKCWAAWGQARTEVLGQGLQTHLGCRCGSAPQPGDFK